MKYSDRDRVSALAGVYQATQLVRDIARTGQSANDVLRASLNSLFVFEPDSVVGVFGGITGVEKGLRTLVTQLEEPQQRDLEIARYVVALIHLADKLRNSGALDVIGKELVSLHGRIREFDLPRPTRIAQVERIYQEHVSTQQPQIMVRGEPLYLQNTELAAQIRGMLLAGIRAAVLWRQCGGKKWQLIFSRGRIASTARELLDQVG